MRWLVTGAAGYIGSKLVPLLLDRGQEVVATDTFRYRNYHTLAGCFPNKDFEFHRVDARDTLSLATLASDCHVVVPLAALVGAPVCDRNPQEATEVNRDAVVKLVKALPKDTRVAFTNTNSGYGMKLGRECVEGDELNPVSLYGTTKVEAEKAVLDRGNSVSLRLATVFGLSPRPRFDLLVNQFTARLVQTGSLTLYQGEFRRNFVHIDDVCNAIFELGRRGYAGVYNCGNPSANMTKRQLAEQVCRALGLPAGAVRDGEGEDPDKRDYLVSNRRLLSTGFEFARSLKDGIREIAAFARHLTPEETALMGNA